MGVFVHIPFSMVFSIISAFSHCRPKPCASSTPPPPDSKVCCPLLYPLQACYYADISNEWNLNVPVASLLN